MSGNLTKIVTMCDVSGSMTEDNSNPLYSAIGLSIRVAEKSALGPRIMTFSEVPSWIQLGTEDSDTFVKQVAKVRKAHWGMTTNFYAAIDLIRKGIEDNKLPFLGYNLAGVFINIVFRRIILRFMGSLKNKS